MFLFHRLLNLTTMMYQEAEELTVIHYLRQQDKEKVTQAADEKLDRAERGEPVEDSGVEAGNVALGGATDMI